MCESREVAINPAPLRRDRAANAKIGLISGSEFLRVLRVWGVWFGGSGSGYRHSGGLCKNSMMLGWQLQCGSDSRRRLGLL